MDFDAVLDQARELLRQRGRLSYQALKRRFALDEAYLDDLKIELIEAEQVATDENGRILVWTGNEEAASPQPRASFDSVSVQPPSPRTSPEAERRQLTVMFCDLVGSTALSEQLNPEELREVVLAYQQTSVEVIERYEGYIAQYLGDGLLVYFGYPVAHEDDAARAVRAGLEIVTAVYDLNAQLITPVQVRIGIHTGPVVVGEVGSGQRTEHLALGETPNIAARVQGQAEPDEVVISAPTQRLVAGLFEIEDRGLHELKGISTPQPLYRVVEESEAHSRFEVAIQAGLTPLVGRDGELQFLQQRWQQAGEGAGQVVLVSGEPGIGKSRLVQELKAQVMDEGAIPIEFRCSPYHQNSALYPITEHLQRLLQFTPDDTPETKLEKLQRTLSRYRFPQADTVPLLAALLSLPPPEDSSPLMLSPQKQRDKTHEALVAWLVEEPDRIPLYTSWEDLHWADPSTLDVLNLLLRQVPTTRLLAVLTFRPEFVSPWGTHSYLSQLALNRLSHPQVSAMVERVTGGKPLPEEVVEQIVTKTDGVPLFVEELTKMVMESDLVKEVNEHYELNGPLPPLAIPSTLQDSLMARLDRLATAREIAQLGATIGREFRYDLLHAVSPLDGETLQQVLLQLVEAELVFQSGVPPQARYLFKHALVQDTAYESLLKSHRQQLHQQVAQTLEQQFPETVETHPELVAHHYTEAGLIEQALPYWQQAGEQATRHSANVEAINHLTKRLELLQTLPDTPERVQQELTLQITRGAPLTAIKGYAASEVGKAYSRARELCLQVGETPQLIPVLFGLWRFYLQRAELQTARELAEHCLSLTQRRHDPVHLLRAHNTLGVTLFYLGELTSAREHLEQGLALHNSQQRRPPAFVQDPLVACLCYMAWVLWHLGYPSQALKRSREASNLAQSLSHPYSLAMALFFEAELYLWRREVPLTQEKAEAAIQLSTDQDFPFWLVQGRCLRGWALVAQGQQEQGITQMSQGLKTYQAMGSMLGPPYYMALLADGYGKVGQPKEGLGILAKALMAVNKSGEDFYRARLYQLKGELTLQLASQPPVARITEAEACFHQALDVARHQSAKSLELRASTSLARLWQQQGKKTEARNLLKPVYHWFTEGFDTKDLQEAKALLTELA